MKRHKESMDKALKLSGDNSPLTEVIRYSLSSGGKRIRPMLTLGFYDACKGSAPGEAGIIALGAAIEMLHISTLIQDDLPCMDDDDERRGKPACHKQFSESDALLAASRMTYNALGMIAESGFGQTARIIKEICGYMALVYDGQKADLAVKDTKADKTQLQEIYALKTCALIQAACVAGVLAANADEDAVRNAHDYGYNLGMAFQLIDDILDGEEYGGAREDAERYTQKALELLGGVPNNEFLTELTNDLLHRSI